MEKRKKYYMIRVNTRNTKQNSIKKYATYLLTEVSFREAIKMTHILQQQHQSLFGIIIPGWENSSQTAKIASKRNHKR